MLWTPELVFFFGWSSFLHQWPDGIALILLQQGTLPELALIAAAGAGLIHLSGWISKTFRVLDQRMPRCGKAGIGTNRIDRYQEYVRQVQSSCLTQFASRKLLDLFASFDERKTS